MSVNASIKKIAKNFGAMSQLSKTLEELTELRDEINKYMTDIEVEADPVDTATDRLNLILEMADVQILLDQLTFLLHAEGDLKMAREYKINRTLERIKTGYYK